MMNLSMKCREILVIDFRGLCIAIIIVFVMLSAFLGAPAGYINNFIDILRQSLEKEIVDKLSFRVPLKINAKMGIKWGDLTAVENM